MPYSSCVRCANCDRFLSVHAKADAEVLGVRRRSSTTTSRC